MLTIYYYDPPNGFKTGWHIVFEELVNYFKNNLGSEIIHKKCSEFFTGDREETHLYVEKFNYYLPDCELLIYDNEKDILKGISWKESRSTLFYIFKERNNKEDILMYTQKWHWFNKYIHDFSDSFVNFKVKGTTFYTIREAGDHSIFYEKRKNLKYEEMIDKIFMLFTTHREDAITLRKMGLCSESPGPLNYENYLDLALQYKVGLSAPSISEICYREIEYMAIGLPNFRLEYLTQLDPPLIPNYHYVSVDRTGLPEDFNSDRNGGEVYVERYVKRFLEVKDDYEFLNFISKNAREYYLNYCSPQNRVKHIINNLEL